MVDGIDQLWGGWPNKLKMEDRMATENRLLSGWFKRLTTPEIVEPDNELQFWQERIVYAFLLFGVVLGPIVLIPGVSLSIKEHLLGVAFLDIFMYLMVVFLFFRRSLPYLVRAAFIIFLSYVLGLVLLITTGPFGAGPVWLFFFPVITGLLTKVRMMAISLLVNVLTLVAFGGLLAFGYHTLTLFDMKPLENWIVIGLNFLFLNSITTISIVITIRGLETSLNQEKFAKYAMEQANVELGDTNLRLTDEISAKIVAQDNLKKSTEALKASEIKYRDLVQMMPLGYFLIDHEYNLQFINKKAVEVFNLGSDQSSVRLEWGKLNFLAPSERERAMDKLRCAMEGEDVGMVQVVAQSSRGHAFPIEIYAEAIYEERRIVGVQGLIVDVSDRLEKEKLKAEKDIVEQTNRAISDWVNFISHEIRNPISAPLSYSRLGIKKLHHEKLLGAFKPLTQIIDQLQQINPDEMKQVSDEVSQLKQSLLKENEKVGTYFHRILKASERIDHLINDLLDLSKLESGRMQFAFEKTNLFNVIKEAVDEMDALADEKKLSLEIEGSDPPIEVECDSFRIGQLVRNLLSNAIKFSPENKKISVSFDTTELEWENQGDNASIPAVTVTVADEGIGIPPDQLYSVFEKFSQSRKTRKGEGTGLGLPICREIINAHDGKIWVESVEEIGTQFHFSIPCR